jgi:hypothetical protein
MSVLLYALTLAAATSEMPATAARANDRAAAPAPPIAIAVVSHLRGGGSSLQRGGRDDRRDWNRGRDDDGRDWRGRDWDDDWDRRRARDWDRWDDRRWRASRIYWMPPGQAKKLYRRGYFPREYWRRGRPVPVVILDRLPRAPRHQRRAVFDGRIITWDERTGTIIDIGVIVPGW